MRGIISETVLKMGGFFMTEMFSLPPIGTNCYLFYDENSREAAVIDPASGEDAILERAKTLGLKIKYMKFSVLKKAGIGLLTIPMKITFFHPMILKS